MTTPPTYFPPWPPVHPFPESTRDSADLGKPDFPGSAGDREQGKFRPSGIPRLTQIAVVNDDGTQIGTALVQSNDEELALLRGILYALHLLTDESVEDLLDGGNSV